MKINNITVLVFSHETEDYEKIINSLNSFFKDFLKYTNISLDTVEGHYGDKITLIKYEIKGKICSKVFEYILSNLDKADLLYFLSTLDDRIDKSRIHIRVDKQKLIMTNKLYLKDGDDVIKIIVSAVGGPKVVKQELMNFVNRNLRLQ